MANVKPTCGQLERSLSQSIQAFYRENLGQQPSKVTCQLFANQVAVVVENSITATEQVLAQDGKENFAKQVRLELNNVTRPQLQQIIEDHVGVSVLDVLCDATLETSRTGIIAVLETAPDVRNPQAIPKAPKRSSSNHSSHTPPTS
ncbi:DUF2294 domain-containing protein [Spirulina sp. CS-785/01]|uniref:DUF2294 domain-containing protein n=1 Tax=Spirulina sp. CS-785/01 TaxID=3021716 RepID=UPI00232F3548|nr:DUF2294 domain-containing protein [Spirulina sp. CS-785/01]MDB9311478.1 DUF2294 domain-containing protein [Spirulina sp. CS-785/01]